MIPKVAQLNVQHHPLLTMMGNDTYDLTVYKNPKKVSESKTLKEEEQIIQHKPEETKHRRKVVIAPDEQRCCADTSKGVRCTLTRYSKSNELCYIHYKKYCPKS